MGAEMNDPNSINRTALSRQPEPLEQLVPEQYQLISKLSDGGMGSVYKAQNRFTGKLFAIKVLLPELAEDNEFRQRFISEARAASSLKHPHICPVHDFGVTADQSLYLAMDWIDGISLQAKVQANGPLDIGTSLLVYKQIAAALADAHQHQIVHRDLKPDNIMLTNHDSPASIHTYLVDFGLAKIMGSEANESQGLTSVGMAVGTPMYMSPEQARAMDVDGRTDIYSLGCVMYFALAGHAPFRADTAMDTMFMHINETPEEFDPKLKVPADLRSIVFKSMEKAPENRYQNVDLLLADLNKFAKGIRLGKVSLSSEEEKKRQKKITVLLFIVGFVVMYFASTMLQSVLDRVFPDKGNTAHSSGAK